MKVSEILGTSYKELSKLSRGELVKAFGSLSHALKERGKTFAKHGEQAPKYQKGLGSSRGLSASEIAEKVSSAAAYMRGKLSGYRGYMEAAEDKRQKIQEAMPDLDLSTIDKLRAYGMFMDEMKMRYPEHMAASSDSIRDMYREAQRLNINPEQFVKNFNYWSEHIADLERARPLNYSRELKPSDYARQLKIETVRDYRKRTGLK